MSLLDNFGLDDAMFAGAAYAMFRHGQDRQTQQLISALSGPQTIEVNVHLDPEENDPGIRAVNALDFTTAQMPDGWDGYIGQEPMKRQLMVYMNSAKTRGARFPHTLLASGYPGVGKTTLARLIAKAMDAKIIELVPPFNIYTLVDALSQLGDKDVLFIDEIHKLADNGKRGAEILLKILEDGVAYMPDGQVFQFDDITIIGATTDRDKLPEPVIDRFKVKPYFQPYATTELIRITMSFAGRHDALDSISDDLAIDIAYACRDTPRIAEELVLAARDLHLSLGRVATGEELLEFVEVEEDGLTRQHIQYLTSMRQFFPRITKDEGIEYVAGEAAMMQLLRETKPGIARVENFLIERGLIDRTPRGRRLTGMGIARAEEFIAQGKGASSA